MMSRYYLQRTTIKYFVGVNARRLIQGRPARVTHKSHLLNSKDFFFVGCVLRTETVKFEMSYVFGILRSCLPRQLLNIKGNHHE
jgi:hypothetical protein